MPDDEREGVALTNLDQPLFDGAGATKRELVDYLDAVADRLITVLRRRPLSVVRARPGQQPFMQKNVPKYAPDWLPTVRLWAETSHREVAYALCEERRAVLWFANQRAVEYHPTLVTVDRFDEPTHLVLDLDPPPGSPFADVVHVAHLVRAALDEVGLHGALKTSGSKGVHIYVPVTKGLSMDDAAAATRALAERTAALDPDRATTAFMKDDRGGRVFVDATRVGWGTVVAAYSPRIRPGATVSFPVAWDDLDAVDPRDFTIATVPGLLGDADPWADAMPMAQTLPDELVAHGHTIPVARVQAMHEGKRRAKARNRDASS